MAILKINAYRLTLMVHCIIAAFVCTLTALKSAQKASVKRQAFTFKIARVHSSLERSVKLKPFSSETAVGKNDVIPASTNLLYIHIIIS